MTESDGSILVVDDESTVRNLVSKVLRAAGYSTTEAEDGLAAYAIIRQQHDSLRLVITDVQMPRMTGTELAERVESEFPDLQILLISGYAGPPSAGRRHFLPKPFTSKSLCATVRQIMGSGRPAPPQPAADTHERSAPDLRLRLKVAREKLEAANRECGALSTQGFDAVDNLLDGRFALRRATNIRKAAFEEYERALREWTEFISAAAKNRHA